MTGKSSHIYSQRGNTALREQLSHTKDRQSCPRAEWAKATYAQPRTELSLIPKILNGQNKGVSFCFCFNPPGCPTQRTALQQSLIGPKKTSSFHLPRNYPHLTLRAWGRTADPKACFQRWGAVPSSTQRGWLCQLCAGRTDAHETAAPRTAGCQGADRPQNRQSAEYSGGDVKRQQRQQKMLAWPNMHPQPRVSDSRSETAHRQERARDLTPSLACGGKDELFNIDV